MPCNLLWWLRPERVHATACATLTTSSNTCLGVRRPTVSVSRRSSTAGSVSRPNRGVAKRHATRLATRGRRTQGGGRCQYLCANLLPSGLVADKLYTNIMSTAGFSPAGVLGLKAKRGTLESKMIVIGGHVGEEETVRPTRKAWITLGNAPNRAVDYTRGRSSRRRGRPIPSALESFCAQLPPLPACERSRRVRYLRAKSLERLMACAKTGTQRPRAPMHHEKDVFMRTYCKAKPHGSPI